MERAGVAVIVCALLLFGIGGPAAALADELQQLKDQLEILQQKIDTLEETQAQQAAEAKSVAKTVDRLKKRPSASKTVASALGDRTTVSGHFKFFLADQSDGTVNDIDQKSSISAGISSLWLYFNKKLTDSIQIELAPEILVEAAATPSLGANIERDDSPSVDIGLSWAYISTRLPWNIEVKAGTFFPYFSEEYASKVWWDEQYNASNGLVTLEDWRSAGIEIYRNFDFPYFSLPVYVYPYLNGDDRGIVQATRYVDNNSHKAFLVHTAPEFYAFGSRLRFPLSFGMGRWDDDGEKNSRQWAAGVDFTRGAVNVSGEYLMRERKALPLAGGGSDDGTDEGWYLKGLYRFTSKWRGLVKYSDVDLWQPSTDALLTDNYKTLNAGINYFFTSTSIIVPQVEYVDAERSDGSVSLEYLRYTLGWRTTY